MEETTKGDDIRKYYGDIGDIKEINQELSIERDNPVKDPYVGEYLFKLNAEIIKKVQYIIPIFAKSKDEAMELFKTIIKDKIYEMYDEAEIEKNVKLISYYNKEKSLVKKEKVANDIKNQEDLLNGGSILSDLDEDE